MPKQLAAFVAAGGRIVVNGREFTVEGVTEDADIRVATFRGPRAAYTGVWCPHTKVAGKVGAEVWSIVGPRKANANFAIHEGRLLALR